MVQRNIGAEIVAGLEEYWDKPESLKRYEFKPVDLKAIRERFGMSQAQMALFLMISKRTWEKWEQGKRKPAGAVNTLLRVMQNEPEAVRRALHT